MDRHYETACIVNPTLADDAIKAVIEQGKKTLTSLSGSDINIEDWGRKKLAYPIEKNNDGYYFFLTYTSSADASKELERTLRLNEVVMRYQTVRLDSPAAPATPAKAAAAPTPAPEAEKTTPEKSTEDKGGE